MDIDGLGEQWSRIFIDQGLVKNVADLYSLENSQLLELDRMGDKLATKILDNVESSKERPLARILFALGIFHVGGEVAELLTQRFNSMEDLAGAKVEDLTEIPGIGPKIAESIIDYFQVPANREVIQQLERAGVKLRREASPGLAATDLADLPWGGLTFVITGTLASMTRREAESRVKALGGSATSSVTGKTNYLVAGESAGSKLATANRLGTSILSESEFLQLLEEPQTTAVE
jgi:DNA ligase (NAD+)